jgi:hypothetical protein
MIKKQDDVLQPLLKSAVGPADGEYDDDNDPDLMGDCPTDSEGEEGT